MSTKLDATTARSLAVDLVIVARDFIRLTPSFGGYAPDSSERQYLRGNAFGAILSNVFGNAR